MSELNDEQKKSLEESYKKVAEAFQRYQEHIHETADNLDLSEVDKKEIVIILYDVLMQSCSSPEGIPSEHHVNIDLSERDDNSWADSRALSAYRDGLKLLESLGLFEVHSEYGRRIIGKFKGW